MSAKKYSIHDISPHALSSVAALFADGKTLTALEICDAQDAPEVERISTLAHLDALDASSLRLFAVDCALRVMHLFEYVYPDDARPRNAIGVATAYARGEIDAAALEAACNAADDAAMKAAGHARDAWSRPAGRDAELEAATEAAWAACWSATGNVAMAADLAAQAAADAVEAATWSVSQAIAERVAQLALFRKYLLRSEGE